MNWSEILLLVCAVLSIFLLLYNSSRHRQIRVFASVAILSVVATLVPDLLAIQETVIVEWAMVTGITAALLALASIIRELKPYYARYPYPFSFTPLAILIFYPMLSDTAVLKDLLNQILQGGALLITLLLAISLARRVENRLSLLTGVGLLIVACIAYWAPVDDSLIPWLWQSTLALGMVLCSWSFMEVSGLLEQGD